MFFFLLVSDLVLVRFLAALAFGIIDRSPLPSRDLNELL